MQFAINLSNDYSLNDLLKKFKNAGFVIPKALYDKEYLKDLFNEDSYLYNYEKTIGVTRLNEHNRSTIYLSYARPLYYCIHELNYEKLDKNGVMHVKVISNKKIKISNISMNEFKYFNRYLYCLLKEENIKEEILNIVKKDDILNNYIKSLINAKNLDEIDSYKFCIVEELRNEINRINGYGYGCGETDVSILNDFINSKNDYEFKKNYLKKIKTNLNCSGSVEYYDKFKKILFITKLFGRNLKSCYDFIFPLRKYYIKMMGDIGFKCIFD